MSLNELSNKLLKMNLSKIIIFLSLGVCFHSYGQEDRSPVYLTFLEAINIASSENLSIAAYNTEELATISDLNDAKSMTLPKFTTSATYQRFSKINLYDGVLGDSKQISKPPNANSGHVGIEGFLNIYKGGKQKSLVEIATNKNELAGIGTEERTADVSLQIVQLYADLVRLLYLKKITIEQINRAQKRLDNITSLYNNGKVTRSDLLRAELMLSKVTLDHNEAKNDYSISNKKLNALINFPESEVIIPSDTLAFKTVDTSSLMEIIHGSSQPYAVQKNEKIIDISEAQVELIKADNLPSLALIGAYGFNYPNNLVLPAMDQTYAVGFVGLRLSYDISSLYQNRHKVHASKFRLEELKLHNKYITYNLQQEKQSLFIKYSEAQNRIEVSEKSIEQARSNYEIINTKYFNQLALLTDLLDADNLYQQSKYDHIKAEISAVIIYYKLLYLTAQL